MHFSILRKPYLIIPLAGLALAVPLSGDPQNRPAWWTDEGTRVIPPGAIENNKGPANIGQAKHMVALALLALDTAAPTVAAQIRGDLATSHPELLTVPSPKPADWADKQKAPLLLGQLKAIAHPFYNQLHAAAPTWLATERATNGTNHPGSIFPWTAETTDDQNKAIAPIGQLKAVFSLRFTQDTDTDGLPDLWEIANFANLNQGANGDTDGDYISNLVEFQYGTNPNNADTDGDGLSDGWEIAHDLDPNDDGSTNPNDGPDGDPDGDSLTNVAELALGTHPRKRDSDGDGVSDPDEILVNFTSPLTATDADGDGIPDDLEKDLAKQFLAFQPNPAAWGIYYTGLAAGNLDSNHDYTGDGVSVGNISSVLIGDSYTNQISNSSPYLLETQKRMSYFGGSYRPASQGQPAIIQGGISLWLTRDTTTIIKTNRLEDFSYNFLNQNFESAVWFPLYRALPLNSPDSIWANTGGANWSCANFQDYPTTDGSRNPYGTFIQTRFRVFSKKISHADYERPLLKVTSRSPALVDGTLLNTTFSAEIMPFSLKNGRFYSNWAETQTTMTDSQSAYALLHTMDLDIVHPATGELADANEDIDDGGYVSVQRLEDPADPTSDVTPKTKMKIHAISGAQSTWKTRLKFNGADRYKIYRDEARTQEVVSEQTEFDATQDTTLFFHGLKKSLARGGELVTMQVKVNDAWVDGDSFKCTIVQSEFLVQVKGFIPYAWTEGEEEVPWAPNGWSPMVGKVAKGDLHTIPGGNKRPASPGFRNAYSTDRKPSGLPNDPTFDLYQNAPFRCCQTIVLTPYKELHSSYDLASLRRAMTAPSSDHYIKATSVNVAEISLKKGYMDLVGGTSSTGKGPVKTKDYRQGARTGKITELHIEYGGVDGALGTTLGFPNASLSPDIHWDMWLKVNSEADPLLPTIEFGGKHDRYPAYEIIVIQSDGTYKPIHNVLPAAGALPGPVSLDDDNAMSIGRSDTIRD